MVKTLDERRGGGGRGRTGQINRIYFSFFLSFFFSGFLWAFRGLSFFLYFLSFRVSRCLSGCLLVCLYSLGPSGEPLCAIPSPSPFHALLAHLIDSSHPPSPIPHRLFTPTLPPPRLYIIGADSLSLPLSLSIFFTSAIICF